jgi:type IV fimbrial biogenesis protein FimT
MHMQDKSFSNIQRGTSLIECCMTLAIVSILAGTAAPALIDSNKKQVVDGRAREIAMDVNFARSEAVARQQGVRISFHAVGGGSCMVVHTGSTADCGCDATGAAQCVNSATAIKSSHFPVAGGLTVSANVASMRFEPVHGTVTPAGTVKLAWASGQTVHQVVNILGRVRTCSPNATKGYLAC